MQRISSVHSDSNAMQERQQLVQQLNEALRDLDDQLEETSSLYEQLAALYHMFGLFGQMPDTDTIPHEVLRFCLENLGATRAFVGLLDGDRLTIKYHTGLEKLNTTEFLLSDEHGLLSFCRNNNRSAIVNDFSVDSRMRCSYCSSLGFKRVVCAPLSLGAKVIGFLVVADTRDGSDFSAGHGKLVTSISHPLANVLENARLRQKEIEKKVLERELEIARRIQQRLLPNTPVEIPGLQICGRTVPALVIGGDYFDFFPLERERIAVVLGDAVGKGVSAGLLMTMLKGMLQVLPIKQSSPGAVLEQINRALFQQDLVEHFVTMVYCVYDGSTRTLCMANAGHEPPVLFHGDGRSPEMLRLACLPLGVKPAEHYQETTITLAPEDVLLIHSDGLSEARNQQDEEFGVERIQRTVQSHLNQDAWDIVQVLHKAVERYVGDLAQHDDVTSIILRVCRNAEDSKQAAS
ncbi:MAG TPA: SpoIIE family protein phosphatase [bacterium]|nr:SpoIIE family protein phosphatase [bacterium]